MAELNKEEFTHKMDDIIKRVAPYTKNNNDPFGGFERAEQAGAITKKEHVFIMTGFIAFILNENGVTELKPKPPVKDIPPFKVVKVEKGDQ